MNVSVGNTPKTGFEPLFEKDSEDATAKWTALEGQTLKGDKEITKEEAKKLETKYDGKNGEEADGKLDAKELKAMVKDHVFSTESGNAIINSAIETHFADKEPTKEEKDEFVSKTFGLPVGEKKECKTTDEEEPCSHKKGEPKKEA